MFEATSADGLTVRYDVRGAGTPALVFVHGWSCDRRYWDAQIDLFAARHRVVAVDLAGHGASDLGRTSWTMPAFGEDVVAVVRQLGLDEVVLIGHSMGGDVVVEAARRIPGRVVGLVWVDAYRSLGRPRPAEAIEAFVAGFRADFVTATRAFARQLFRPDSDPDLVERVTADMSAAPPDVAVDALRHAFGNEPAAVAGLRETGRPVVAINRADGSTDVGSLRRHGVAAVLMPGVGHFPMMEDPDAFNRVLAQVVEDLTRPRDA